MADTFPKLKVTDKNTPMMELTKFKDENLCITAASNSQIKLNDQNYYVTEGKKRYLWHATRMGMSIVKDALALKSYKHTI